MNDWLMKHPGVIMFVAGAFNLWLAATSFSKGGLWYVVSAGHVATCALLLHAFLHARKIRRENAARRAEFDATMRDIIRRAEE